MRINYRDLAAAGLFAAIGLFFAIYAGVGLRLGTATRMGPGFFPLALGLVLVGFALAIALNALRSATEPLGPVPWRGIALVTGAVVFFAATIDTLGLAPAMGGATLMAALSPREATWRGALATSAAVTALSVVVFVFALRLPLSVFGP